MKRAEKASAGKGIIRIGTSGIAVPGPKPTFPIEFQQKSRLNYYSTLFNTIEVNSTFYKLPMLSTFDKWSQDVNVDFQFTLKLLRDVTHAKELNFELEVIDTYLHACDSIGTKKGCLLVQFPGKITLEYFSHVESILSRLCEMDQLSQWKLAVELRNNTWYVSETHELLKEYNATLVLHDIPKSRNNFINDSCPFQYFRYHGPKGDYRGSYTDEFLLEQALLMKDLQDKGKQVYVYFNNTAGSAYENAMSLKRMVE